MMSAHRLSDVGHSQLLRSFSFLRNKPLAAVITSIAHGRSRLDLGGNAHFVLHDLHHSHPDNVWKIEQ